MLILFHIAAENFVTDDAVKLVIPPALLPLVVTPPTLSLIFISHVSSGSREP